MQARAAAPALPTLTSVAEVRNLSPAEAALGYPVRYKATVLLNDHVEKGGALNEVFVHDGHMGIYAGCHGPALGLQPGDVVELAGRPDVGGFAPYVADPRFDKLATAALPPPRPTTIAEALGGSEDSQWAEITGVVHAVYWAEDRLHLQIVAAREKIVVEFADGGQGGPGKPAAGRCSHQGARGRLSGVQQPQTTAGCQPLQPQPDVRAGCHDAAGRPL